MNPHAELLRKARYALSTLQAWDKLHGTELVDLKSDTDFSVSGLPLKSCMLCRDFAV